MRKLSSKKQVAILGTLMLVAALGASALFSKAEACGCRCPLIYAPVTCDHGKTYPNPCVAECHHAKNCVPSGL